ncbi:MAG: hypothetical protein AAFZ11_07600 [Pseudomonadota bacterium]
MTPSLLLKAGLASLALFAGNVPASAQDAANPADMDPEQMAQALEKLTKMLTDADANEDGKTTREELAKARGDQFSKLDRNDDGVVNSKDKPRGPVRRGKFGEALEQVTNQFDTDLDGTVTRAEWNTLKVDPFEMLDANGDDAIDQSEIPSADMLNGGAM